MAEEFEWTGEDEVVPAQARTAAYFNPKGNLVIRQENESRGEDDVVVIAITNVRTLIDKLESLLSQVGSGGEGEEHT